MQVSSINKAYNVNTIFLANPYSAKLKFTEDDFFISIKGYEKNHQWAAKVIETAQNAYRNILKECNLEATLKDIAEGVRSANYLQTDESKRVHSSILRTQRQGWRHGSEWDGYELITKYGERGLCKYDSYTNRLDYIAKNPLIAPFQNIDLTRPICDINEGKFLRHGDYSYINNAFRHITFIYNDLYKRFIEKEAQEQNLDSINSGIAEIRWILAHATPWERGSDAISNVLVKAIYKAMGIKTYPIKRGISLDLEAYCTNLDEYKKRFASYFKRQPKIVD